MKTREFAVRTKFVACVMAGSMAFLNAGGASFVSIAHAQKPTAPAAAPPPAAGPKPNINEAKKRYAMGEKKYGDKDFAGALTDFQAADAIKSTAHSQRWIGLCHEALGHFPEAVDSYEHFLAAVPKGMDAAADDIKARVTKIKGMPAKVHFETTPPGAQVLIDDKALGITPTDIDVAPGTHTIKFVLDKYEPNLTSLDAKYASKAEVKATLTAKVDTTPPPVAAVPTTPPSSSAPPPPPPAPVEPRSMLPAYITGGLAIAAAGVGAVFGVIALGDKSDFDKNPSSGKADDGENHALIADMAFFVAVTLGVTSAVLFLTRDDAPATGSVGAPRVGAAAPKKKAFTITPTPIVTPTGGGMGAVIRF